MTPQSPTKLAINGTVRHYPKAQLAIYRLGFVFYGFLFFSFLFCNLLILSGCEKPAAPVVSLAETYPGGDTTVSLVPFPSFDKPASNLPSTAKPEFYAGKALAEQPWIKAPTTTTARDGLGPLYNARTCLTCHINGGRGTVPESGGGLIHGIVRLSITEKNTEADKLLLKLLGVVPNPVYGDQLQTQSTSLSHQLRHSLAASGQELKHDIAPEATVIIHWQEQAFNYADGTTTLLRKPQLDIQNLGYGVLPQGTLVSLRNAPAIHGVGLLELIPQVSIDALADPDDNTHNGISGRTNLVWDIEQKKKLPGRFGYKNNRSSLSSAIAGAFANDIGISNPLFPQQPCSSAQAACLAQPTGNDKEGVELPQRLLDLVVNFNRNLGVPSRRGEKTANVLKGRKLFFKTGCSACHHPSFITGTRNNFPHLSEQIIWPYSDLLLHDMGEGLADNRPDFDATGNEWRTAPLWGLGLSGKVNGSYALLHDGRARNVEEAILWHDGEAAAVTQKFIALTNQERGSLIAFVESL